MVRELVAPVAVFFPYELSSMQHASVDRWN